MGLYQGGLPPCHATVVNISDNTTTIYTGKCIFYGWTVNTALSAHVNLITDGATTVFSTAASAPVGTTITFPMGVEFNTSLLINQDDSATGSITVFWREE